jgi:hypothetical protein
MKILFNNKGISLVILIVAMTLIAILGTSFVSLMGSKQKGFLSQIDSYRALNVANAGVEYAIRYVSDGLRDTTNPSNNFFSTPSSAVTRSFAGGIFIFTYDHINNNITVAGSYPDPSPLSRRDVKVSNFRRYLSPISLIPDGSLTSIPQISVNDTNVWTISNNESSFTVTRIDVSITANSNIYLNILRDGVDVFNYSSTEYPQCNVTIPINSPTCIDSTGSMAIPGFTRGIYIETGSRTFRFDLSSPYPSHTMHSTHLYTLHFSAPPPTGLYTMNFYTSLSLGNPYTIRFSP